MKSLLGASTAMLGYKMTADQLDQFTAGYVFGFTGHNDLDQIKTCLKNPDQLETDLSQALTDLHGGTIGDLLHGVEEMGHVMWELPSDLSGCSGGTIKDDMSEIHKWALQFINPVTLMAALTKNLMANFGEIMTTMGEFQDDYTKGNFYNAGKDISTVMSDALGKPSSTASADFASDLSAWMNTEVPKFLNGDDLSLY